MRTGLTYSLAASVEDSLKTGVPNGGFLAKYIETLFGLQSTFRFLEMRSIRRYKICICSVILASSETQGQIKGARESLNGRKNIYGTKKSKERREESLGTMSYQTSSKRSPPFWLLIGARKFVFFWHQSEARTAATVWNWSGKTLSPGALLAVLYFSSCHIFFRPFRLFLVPTICPWVSEDVILGELESFRNYKGFSIIFPKILEAI